MPGKTKGGLTVVNYSRYSTDDIVCLLNAIEHHLFGRSRPVVFSTRTAGETIYIYQATGALKRETIVKRGSITDRSPFAKATASRSMRPSSVKVCHPDHAFDNILQQLVAEDAPRIPDRAVEDLTIALMGFYVQPNGYPDPDRFRTIPIRVVKKIEDKKPREARRADRRAANKECNSTEFALFSVVNTINHINRSDEVPHPALVGLRGEVEALLAAANRLRDSISTIRNTILLPNTRKE
jgi:hypothetical protein